MLDKVWHWKKDNFYISKCPCPTFVFSSISLVLVMCVLSFINKVM